MKANGNFSDASFERLHFVSVSIMMSPSDAVDLESLLDLVYALVFFWNLPSCSTMQLATFLKFYVHNAVVECKTVADVKGLGMPTKETP